MEKIQNLKQKNQKGEKLKMGIKYIEYLETWNGILPEVMTGTGATIMIPTPTE